MTHLPLKHISPRRYSCLDVARIEEALECARKAHRGTRRKVSAAPYIVHPLGVAAKLAEVGYGADFVIAGLLHDTIEDGVLTRTEVESRFGAAVGQLVAGVTNPAGQGAWRGRKQRALRQLRGAPAECLALKCADALDNLRSIRSDLERYGDLVWRRLRPEPQMRWYFRSLSRLFDAGLRDERGSHLAADFRAEIRDVFRRAGSPAAR